MASRTGYQRLAYRAVADISGTILVPVTAAVLASKLLTLGQAATIGVLGFAFFATALVLVNKIRFYGKAYRDLVDASPAERDGEHHGDGAARS